jgi:hypothetical protein
MLDDNSRQNVAARGKWLLAGFVVLLLGFCSIMSFSKHRQMSDRMAMLPLVSVAEDGAVTVNGHKLVITSEGQLPEALELVEGGPAQELKLAKFRADTYEKDGITATDWIFPRTGIGIEVLKKKIDGSFKAMCLLKLDLKEVGNRLGIGFHGTFEFRGQKWWLVEDVMLNKRDFSSIVRPMDIISRSEWVLTEGSSEITAIFERDRLAFIEINMY